MQLKIFLWLTTFNILVWNVCLLFVVVFQSFAGGMVDGYTVMIVPNPPNSSANRNVTNTTTTLTVEGLADYTNYTFTVAAYNAAGVGPATPSETVSTVEGG